MRNTYFYSVKGGSGTSLTACAFALLASENQRVLIRSHDVDETLAMLGLPSRNEDRVVATASANLNVTSIDAEFDYDPGYDHTVYDLGTNPDPGLIEDAPDDVFLVIRPDYLALRKALKTSFDPSSVILVAEPGRSLQRADVEDVLGKTVRVTIPVQPAIATAVDAGLLARRLPNKLASSLRAIVPNYTATRGT